MNDNKHALELQISCILRENKSVQRIGAIYSLRKMCHLKFEEHIICLQFKKYLYSKHPIIWKQIKINTDNFPNQPN